MLREPETEGIREEEFIVHIQDQSIPEAVEATQKEGGRAEEGSKQEGKLF